MTEEEWLRSEDPEPLLEHLASRGLASERKLRLLSVALCQLWGLFTDSRLIRLLNLAEAHADGRVEERARADAEKALLAAFDRELDRDDEFGVSCLPILRLVGRDTYTSADAHQAAGCLANWACYAEQDWAGEYKPEFALEQVPYLRDIFGNPFRPVAVPPCWRTSNAVALAREVYESRDFGAMPILADALQDAGCDSADVLDHCRGPGPHVRGCWVLDLVLGKE